MLNEQQMSTRAMQARLDAMQANHRALQGELEKHRAPTVTAPRSVNNPLLLVALGAMAALGIAAGFGLRVTPEAPAPSLPQSMIREEL